MSVPLNINEGIYSRGKNRSARLTNAMASAKESVACLEVAAAVGYVGADTIAESPPHIGLKLMLVPQIRSRTSRAIRKEKATMDKDNMTIIGCDLGDRTSHLCLLDREGAVLRRTKIASTQKAFDKFFAGLESCLVVLEVGGHSRWSSALIRELGHRCLVANPRHVRLIYGGTHKNDRLDAEALARLGRLDPTLLRPVEHRSQEAQTQLSTLKARDALVCNRTRLIASVRGIAKSAGMRLVACDADYFTRKVTLPPTLQPALGAMLQNIEELTAHIKQYDKQIAQLCAQKRAVVAVARKLAVLLHRLWVSGELYEPLRLTPDQSCAA